MPVIHTNGNRIVDFLSLLSLLSPILLPPTTASPILMTTSMAAFSVFIRSIGLTCIEGEGGSSETIGQINLCADEIGKVRNHEHVLDVVVEVAFNIGWVDFWRKSQGVHEILTEDNRRLFFFIEHIGDIGGYSLNHVNNMD